MEARCFDARGRGRGRVLRHLLRPLRVLSLTIAAMVLGGEVAPREVVEVISRTINPRTAA